MRIRVLAIAPYPGLKDLLLDMANEDESIEMDVETADLQEAIPLVRHAEQQGYHIILSRGGTATLIRKHSSLPVVDIPVSGYDILRVLTLVKNANSKVAIIGFPNICHGVGEVSSLLDFNIPAYAVEHESEVAGALRKAFQADVKIVLGDAVTVRTAREMGYNGILITSGRESVMEAMANIRKVYEVYRRGLEEVRFFHGILDADPRGILVLDGTRTIRYVNRAAGLILGHSQEQLAGNSLILYSPALAELLKRMEEGVRPDSERYVHLQDRQYKVTIVNREPKGETGWLVYIDALERGRDERLSPVHIPPRLATFAQLIGASSTLQKAIGRARKFAKSDRNIWIYGERGTGKSLFAQAIHSASRRHDQGFYMVSCDELTEEQTEMLLSGTNHSPGLFQGGFTGTLYVRNADRMTRIAQEHWVRAIRSNRDVRIVASSSIPVSKLQNRIEYNDELILTMGELQLTVPQLRDRLEDLEEMIRVMIAEYNSESGKQIVGIREPVLDRLAQYEWPGNIVELENVIREMLILTKGHYTELSEANEVLDRLQHTKGKTGHTEAYAQIDLSGTLEQIEERILWHVLQEEGLNQSRACKRLGINRSTLWRKTNKLFKNETD